MPPAGPIWPTVHGPCELQVLGPVAGIVDIVVVVAFTVGGVVVGDPVCLTVVDVARIGIDGIVVVDVVVPKAAFFVRGAVVF